MTNELVQEFEEAFSTTQKELGFKADLDTLEKIFFLKDGIQQEGFVSTRLDRFICSRICNLFMSWNNYLHDLVMPNPQSMFLVTESHMFNEEEKQKMVILMNQIMAHIRINHLVGLSKDKKKEAAFIDESVTFWEKKVDPAIQAILKKTQEEWQKKAENPENKPAERNNFR